MNKLWGGSNPIKSSTGSQPDKPEFSSKCVESSKLVRRSFTENLTKNEERSKIIRQSNGRQHNERIDSGAFSEGET